MTDILSEDELIKVLKIWYKGEHTQAYKQIWEMIKKPEVDEGWLPTPENINALPEPVRNYIADMQTNADPPSMVADNIILRDTVKALEMKLEEKLEVTEEWIDNFVEEKAKEFIVRANIAIQNPGAYRQQLDITKDFIRSLVEGINDVQKI